MQDSPFNLYLYNNNKGAANSNLFIKTAGLDKNAGNLIRVTVGRGSPVLEVALTLLSNTTWNSDRTATIGHAGTEVVDGGCLVESGQPALVIFSLIRVVRFDVANVMARQLVNGLLDLGEAALLTHLER